MAGIKYKTRMPKLVQDRRGGWALSWDRSPEISSIVDFFDGPLDEGQACILFDADSIALSNIVDGVSKKLQRDVIWTRVLSDPDDYICALIVSEFVRNTRIFPVSMGLEVLKYTSGSKIYRHARSYHMRALSNLIHRQRRAGNPITLREALRQTGLRPGYEAPELDVLLDDKYLGAKRAIARYRGLIALDIDNIPRLSTYISTVIVGVRSSSVSTGTYWDGFLDSIPGLKVIFQSAYSDRNESGTVRTPSKRYMEITLALLSPEEATKVLQPAIDDFVHRDRDSMISAIISSSGFTRSTEAGPVRALSEERIVRVLDSFKASTEAGLAKVNLEPKPAPIDATIDGGVLTLRGREEPSTTTPLDHLDALRQSHLEDVARLRSQLSGSNAGEGFLARLEAVERRLAEPLSHATSLILANQVRALEDMLPAVRDMLTDVTAADLGGAVSGLGLYVRQFPAWRAFVAEAEDGLEIEAEVIADIVSIIENIRSQPDSIVDPSLKEGLADVEGAADVVKDVVLQAGLSRSASNTYKAIGRYLREALGDILGKYGEEVKARIASRMVDATFVGLMLAVSDPLLRLASAAPNEYGWLLGLLLVLGVKKSE